MNASPSKQVIDLKLQDLIILVQTDLLLKLSKIVDKKEENQPEQQNATQTEGLETLEAKVPLELRLQIVNNLFLLPSVDYSNSLVTKGDIKMILNIIPPDT